jgi:hypothetical protein
MRECDCEICPACDFRHAWWDTCYTSSPGEVTDPTECMTHNEKEVES